ncbi:hypothetical protein FA95DRAFT_1675101 [Auriscalpium vulgare]|uniref:Uncharacterized protein n=1 Tax=Auriscalpium vulgare TaxID=40419 RepID=A0ACB8S7M2_9AGAM|nr:hypothetical protein FA95DRAFT_1675101 [Auriscalpium vulgare]
MPLVVDIQTAAGDLAHRLSSLRHFISAGQDLLDSIRLLRSEILSRQCKKVVTLAEISRATLSRVGIKLHLFTSCPPVLQQFKSLYFDILRALRERLDVFVGANLKDRVKRLLLPLSSWMVIRRADGPPASARVQTRPARPSASPYHLAAVPFPRADQSTQRRSSPALATSMPPPPSLPRRNRQSPDPDRHSSVVRLDLFPELVVHTRSPRRHTPASSTEQDDRENDPAIVSDLVTVQRPTPRRFGIFCTGGNAALAKTERRNRPHSPRSSRYS